MKKLSICLALLLAFLTSCQKERKDFVGDDRPDLIPRLFSYFAPEVSQYAAVAADDYIAIVQVTNGKKGGWTGDDFPVVRIIFSESASDYLFQGSLVINGQAYAINEPPTQYTSYSDPFIHSLFGSDVNFVLKSQNGAVFADTLIYIPKQLEIPFTSNLPSITSTGGQLAWNKDSLNPHGVLITLKYHPMDNPFSGGSGQSQIINGAAYSPSDDGYYSYSQINVSRFPADSNLRLRVIRGNYAVLNTSAGKILIVCASDVFGFVHFD